jgi:peptidyl-prolyl cis-trans isomerase C
MTRQMPLLAVMALAALAAGCSHKNETDAKSASVATVDGRAISRNTFEQYTKNMAGKPAADLTAEERDKYLDDLVQAEVIAAQAERDGIDKLDETRAALDLDRMQVLLHASQQEYLKDRRPSEEELRAEYDIQMAQLGKTEFRASQILAPTEATARQIIAQLKGGADFAALAKSQSQDANTRDKGGDLGWFSPGEGIIGNVVKNMKKGETTPEPVKTQYGFHVLKITDTRDATPPPYDKVKDRLVQLVEQKKYKAYVDGLKAKAKVEKSLQ